TSATATGPPWSRNRCQTACSTTSRRAARRSRLSSPVRISGVMRHEDHGFAAALHAHRVPETEDARLRRRGNFHAQRDAHVDVDLVEVARALEDAHRHLPRNAGAAPHARLRQRERLRTHDEEATIARME